MDSLNQVKNNTASEKHNTDTFKRENVRLLSEAHSSTSKIVDFDTKKKKYKKDIEGLQEQVKRLSQVNIVSDDDFECDVESLSKLKDKWLRDEKIAKDVAYAKLVSKEEAKRFQKEKSEDIDKYAEVARQMQEQESEGTNKKHKLADMPISVPKQYYT